MKIHISNGSCDKIRSFKKIFGGNNMARVFIGVGHGGTDPGAVGYLVEKDVNLKMARACYDYLQARGIDTRISRTGM